MAGFKVIGTHHTSFTANDIDRVLVFLGAGPGYQVSAKVACLRDHEGFSFEFIQKAPA